MGGRGFGGTVARRFGVWLCGCLAWRCTDDFGDEFYCSPSRAVHTPWSWHEYKTISSDPLLITSLHLKSNRQAGLAQKIRTSQSAPSFAQSSLPLKSTS